MKKKSSKQSSEEPKTYFSNPAYANIPFQAFVVDVEIPKKAPPDSEVDTLFNKIISDYEFSPAKKQMYNSKSTSEKWNMYVDQIKEDSNSPSPEYLLKCLQVRPGPEVLAEIAKLIEKKRCSFIQRFIGLNLHQFCLSLLCTFNRKSNPFNPSDLPLNEVITNSLLCLRNFSKTQFGISLSAYSEAIPYLVESISSSSSVNLESAIDILNIFLIDNKSAPIVPNIKSCIKALEVQTKSIWNNFIKELTKQDKSIINLLSVFTNRMTQIVKEPGIRLRVVIAMEKNGYINSFKAVKADPTNKIIEPIKQRFNTDISMLKTISSTIMANPFSIKSLTKSIKELAQPPKLYHSFLLSFYDVLVNFKMSRISLLAFLHNFLLIYRYFLSKNDKTKLAVAAASAAANTQPIELQLTAAKYKITDSHKQLYQDSYFICDAELASLDLPKLCKIVSSVGEAQPQAAAEPQPPKPQESNAPADSDLKAKLTEKTNEITQLKKKLIAALQENKTLKEESEKSSSSNKEIEAQKNEIAQLKSQVESLRAENETLKNQNQQYLASEAQKADLSGEITQLKKKLITALQDKKTLKTENAQHVAANKEKEDKNNELLSEIDQLKKQVDSLLNENNTLKSDSEQQLVVIKDREAKVDELNKLKEENSQVTAELNQLKEQLSQVSAQTGQSKQEVDQLTQQVQEANQKLAQKTEECAKAEKESSSLREEIETLKKLGDSNTNEVANLKEENDKLSKEVDSLKSQISEKATAADQTANEVSSLKSQVDASNQQITTLKTQNTTISAELGKLKSQLSSKDASLDSIKSQKESVEKDLEKIRTELKELKSSKETDDSARSNLESELSSAKQQLEEANNQINALKLEKQNVEKSSADSASSLQNQIDSLQSQIKSLENSVSDKDEHINKLNETVESQSNELKAASTKEDELNKQISDLLSKGSDDEQLQAQLAEKDKLLSSQKNELEDLKKQIDKLNDDVSNKSSELRSANDKVDSQEQEITKLKDQNQNALNSKEQEIAQLKNQTEQDQNTIKSKEQEIAQLKNQTEQDQNTIKSKEQEIVQLKNQAEEVQSALKSKEQEIEALKSQSSDSQKDSDIKSEEIANLKSQVSNLESQLKSTKDELESKSNDLQSAKEAIEKDASASQNELLELKSKYAQLEKELNQANADKETHLNSIKSKETEIDSLKSKSDDHAKEIEQLKNQLQNSQNQIEQLKSESQAHQQKQKESENEKDGHIQEINSLKQQIKKLNDEVQSTKSQLDQHNLSSEQSSKESAKLQSELEQAKKEADDYKEKLEQSQKESLQLKSQVDEFEKNSKEMLQRIENEKQSRNDEINSLKEQIEKLNEETQNAKLQLESAHSQLDLQNSTSEQSMQDTAKLQSELEQAKKEVQEYRDKLEEAHKDTVQLKSQIDDFEKTSKASIAKLETTLLDNERLIVEVQSQKDIINQLSLSNEQNETNQSLLKDELVDLKNKYESIEKQNNELHSEIERKTAENAKLKKDLVDLTPSKNAQLQEQQHQERVRKISDASLSKSLPKKPLLNPPTTKTCLFQWTKLPEDLIKTSLWSAINENSINFDSSLFASTMHFIPQFKLANSNNFLVLTKLEQDTAVELLRTMNILNNSDYYQIFTNDILELLQSIVPTDEEAEYLSSMNDNDLSSYEIFMKKLSTIPSLKMRVQFLLIQRNFSNNVEQLTKPLEEISKGLDFLLKSEKIKELFATILKIGNYSNGGNEEYGGAYGFALSSFKKIRETEIPMFIARNYPELVQELDLLKPMLEHRELKLRKSNETIQEYSEKLLLCMLEMPNAEVRLKDGDNFWTVFMNFYEAYRYTIDSAKELSLEAIKNLNEAILLFGEEENEEFSDFACKFVPLINEMNRGKLIVSSFDQQSSNASKADSNNNANGELEFQHESRPSAAAATIAQYKDNLKNAFGKFFTKK